MELAFASGWSADDFVFFPDRYADRREVTAQTVSAVQALWATGVAVRVNGVGAVASLTLHPRPTRPEIPVWVTSAGSAGTAQWAGKLGAGLLTHVVDQDMSVLADRVRVYQEAAGGGGRVALMLHTYIGSASSQVDDVVGSPLRAYLRSAMRLEMQAAANSGTGNDDLSDDLLDELVEQSYERYRFATSLMGSPRQCADRLRYLQTIGVGEIACLVDFGISEDEIIASLDRLEQVRAALPLPAGQQARERKE